MKRIVYIGVLIILYGCGRIYESYLPSWLGVREVEIEDYKYLDVMTGIGGEGATLEIYTLSIKDINQILLSIDTVALSSIEDFNYHINWKKGFWMKKDSSFIALFKGNLSTSGFGKMEPYLDEMIHLLEKNTTYIAVYFNRKDLFNSYRFIYLLFDSINRKLYVYDLMT